MKLKINKKKLKNLTKDAKALPLDMTPQIAGGYTTYRTWSKNGDCENTRG